MKARIHSEKNFSTFLVRMLVLIEAVSLTLVIGLAYWMVSRSMTRGFLHQLQIQRAEAGTTLADHLLKLEARDRDLSLNHAVITDLKLGGRNRIKGTMEQQYPRATDAVWLVREKGTGAFDPALPDRLTVLKGFLTTLAHKNRPETIKFIGFKDKSFLSVFSSPIMEKGNPLGTAYLIYDLSKDSNFWLQVNKYHKCRLLIRSENSLTDLANGQKYPVSGDKNKMSSLATSAGTWYGTIPDEAMLPLNGFPGIFYATPLTSLSREKHSLIILLVTLGTGTFLLVILVAPFIAGKMAHPLEIISDQALDLARGAAPLSLQTEKIPYAECRKLIQAFNVLFTSLSQAHQELKKNAEKKLDESEDRYRKTLEAAPFSITITRATDGHYLMVNDAFCRITGYSKEEILGKTSLDLSFFVNPSDREDFIKSLKEKGEVENIEIPFRRKDGSIFYGLNSARSLDYNGWECLVVVSVDITERKRAGEERLRLETQLLHAQKMEAVGTLAGGVAHDFRNLLQGILGYCDLLLLKKRNDPDSAKIQEIKHAAQRASELTRQLLTFGRKVESEKKPISLNHEVTRAQKLLQRTIPRMIDIGLELADDLAIINADPIQVQQVIMNLGINSRDAMPDGGKMVMRTSNVELDEAFCRNHVGIEPGKYVELSFADTGSGMDEKTLEHMYEPFFTTKEPGKGTGLGMATIYGIIKNHKGSIDCTSKPGHGTRFSIYLPAIDENPADEHQTVLQPLQLEGGKETILLVDDEALVRDFVYEVLTKFGYKVIAALTGEEALEVYADANGAIDLTILDLNMPGMGGNRCLQKLLQLDPGAKVLIGSGYSIDFLEKSSIEAKVNAFLTKPYTVEQILREVRRALDAGSPTSDIR